MNVIRKLVLFIFSLIILIPLSALLTISFKTMIDMYGGPLEGWDQWTVVNYVSIITEKNLGMYFKNSVIVTLFSVSLTLLFASFIAYAIIRLPRRMSMIVFAFFTLGMLIPAQVNMVPLYSLIFSLGLTNSLLGLILVNIAATIPVAVFILTGFMKTLPTELFESATIDGASHWGIYYRIAIPLSTPAVTATSIFLMVMHWNDLLYPLLFITNNQYKTLPLALLDFQGEYLTNYPMLFSGVILSSIPLVILYFFLQRYFVAGMTAGAVKG